MAGLVGFGVAEDYDMVYEEGHPCRDTTAPARPQLLALPKDAKRSFRIGYLH